MEKVLEIQKKAFLKEGPPSLEIRKDLLKRCVALIETHDEKIIPTFKRIYHIRDGVTHEEVGEGRAFE